MNNYCVVSQRPLTRQQMLEALHWFDFEGIDLTDIDLDKNLNHPDVPGDKIYLLEMIPGTALDFCKTVKGQPR